MDILEMQQTLKRHYIQLLPIFSLFMKIEYRSNHCVRLIEN